MTRVCTYCKTELGDDWIFCEQCGKKIEKKETQATQKVIELIKSMLEIENRRFYTIYEVKKYLVETFHLSPDIEIGKEMLIELCKQLFKEDHIYYYLFGDKNSIMLYKAKSFTEWQRYAIGIIYEPNIVVNDKKFGINDFILRVYDAFYSTTCLKENHKVENVSIKAPTPAGRTVTFNAFYCPKCNKYFTSKEEFEKYFPLYKPMMKLRIFGDSSINRREQSELMIYGYSARADGPSEYERQSLLAYLMSYDILPKSRIIAILQDHINYNGRKVNMENAVSKWEADIDFVNNYELNRQRLISTDKLSYIYKATKGCFVPKSVV